MRVALFSPYLPAPPSTGGRIRIYQWLKRMDSRVELHLFAAAAQRELSPQTREQLTMVDELHVVPPALVISPWPALPRRVRRFVPSQLERAFWKNHQQKAYDLVWVEHVHAARVAYEASLPWLLDEHNVESQYLRAKMSARGKVGMIGEHDVRALERWEKKMWCAATEVVCVTEADATRVAEVRGQAPVIIPNGVDLRITPYVSPLARTGEKRVLFVGLMNHPPNEQAASELAQKVMPLVWAQHADARLVLCGANPSKKVLSLASDRVEVTGTVPSVQAYLQQAHVFANLLYHGGGSSLKVVEALASGVPLISTAVGVRGFKLDNGTHYLEANTTQDMALQINRVLNGDPSAEARSRAGRSEAEKYDWATLSQAFQSTLLSIV